jgi:hypothetical protein
MLEFDISYLVSLAKSLDIVIKYSSEGMHSEELLNEESSMPFNSA